MRRNLPACFCHVDLNIWKKKRLITWRTDRSLNKCSQSTVISASLSSLMYSQVWACHKLQWCMFKCVRNWLKLKPAISFIDNSAAGEEHAEHRGTRHISWMETVPLLSVCCPHSPPHHSSTDVMTKERARCWSVRMIHCQFSGLFIKLRTVQQLGRWSRPPNSCHNLHIDTYDGAALIGDDWEEMTSQQTLWFDWVRLSGGDNWSGH